MMHSTSDIEPVEHEYNSSAYFNFIYALKAAETKRHYLKRLEVFLDYLKLEGSRRESR